MKIRKIGRLHFVVESQSRPNPDFDRQFGPGEHLRDVEATEHMVDLEPVEIGGEPLHVSFGSSAAA